MNVSRKIALSALAALAALAVAPRSFAAFTMIQATGARYKASSGPVACPGGTCRTTLDPLQAVDLGALTDLKLVDLSTDLDEQKPGFTVDKIGPSLDLNFTISFYIAANDGKEGGANFYVDFTPQRDAVIPTGLHWIQIVRDNFNISGINGDDSSAPKGPGMPENIVDSIGSTSPYYDVWASERKPPFNATPPHFEDFSGRPEPTAANPTITWGADLFLVSDPGGDKKLTVYNGVHWGWVSQFTAAPEPGAWTLIILGFGLSGLALRIRKVRQTA